MKFLSKLVQGDFGLLKTFYLFLILPGILFNGFILAVEEGYLDWIGMYVFLSTASIVFVFQIIAIIGTWNAASKYEGYALWKWAAKAYVIYDIIMALLVISIIF